MKNCWGWIFLLVSITLLNNQSNFPPIPPRSIDLLSSMVQGAPKQLSVSLPKVVPVLAEVVNDTHVKVKEAARDALEKVGNVVSNPEIRKLAPILLASLSSASEDKTKRALDELLNTSFVHSVDAPSLALLCPLILRALKERTAEFKRKGAQIIGSMVLLIREPKDIEPHLPVLLPALKQTLIDPIPDVRATTAKAFGTVAQGLPEEMLGRGSFGTVAQGLPEEMLGSGWGRTLSWHRSLGSREGDF